MAKKTEEKEELKKAPPMKGELSETELNLLKQTHPKLRIIRFEYGDVVEEGEWGVVYVKPFTIPLYEVALQMDKEGKIKLATWILTNLRIAGMEAKEILEDIDWLKNFATTAQALIWQKYGSVKKN